MDIGIPSVQARANNSDCVTCFFPVLAGNQWISVQYMSLGNLAT